MGATLSLLTSYYYKPQKRQPKIVEHQFSASVEILYFREAL